MNRIFLLILMTSVCAVAAPTNLPAPARVSVTIDTNSVLVGLGTNLFRTNLTLVRVAGIVAPTNAGTSGQVVSRTGDQTKWADATATQTNILVANVLNAGTAAYSNTAAFVLFPTNSGTLGQVVSLTGDKTKWVDDAGASGGIPTLNGSGTNTTLYFDNAKFGTNHLNTGGTLTKYSIIGGGAWNKITSSGGSDGVSGGVISGGISNTINPIASFINAATISGGELNQIGSQSQGSTISGGYNNSISANQAVISGGENNLISGSAGGAGSVISGGVDNYSTATYAAIAGGFRNSISNNSSYSTIAGGASNAISGAGSFASGRKAQATNSGVFMFSDGIGVFRSTSTNQFLIQALNGVGINTNNPGTNALLVVGNIDSTVGFSINGVPISGPGSAGYTNTLFTNMVVYSASGAANVTLMDSSIEYARFHPTNIQIETVMTVANDLRFPKLTWSGATNTLSLVNKYYHYATSTDASITGLTEIDANYAQWVVLRITNSAATAKTLYLPATWTTDDGARSYVLTNATVSILSVGTYGTSMTNAVFRTMY